MTASGATATRELSTAMMADVRGASAASLEFRGIDLGPAVEQVLFSTLRAGSAPDVGPRRRILRRLRRPAAALSAWPRPAALPRADVLVIMLAEVHRRLFAPVAAELGRIDAGITTVELTAGRGARDPRLTELPAVARQLRPRSAIMLLTHRVDGRSLARSTRGWSAMVGSEAAASLRGLVADSIGRMAIEAARLDDTMAAVRPRAVVAYDEIDAWGRLVSSVAHRHGVTSVDLPHAEAVDVEAIRGAQYDLMGVYGPRAASVMVAAGISDDRIVVVGPARFDALVRASRHDVDEPRRVVLAAQYRGGRMTDAVRAGILAGGVAAAEAIGGIVDLVPHPTEPASAWDSALAGRPLRTDVEVRVARREVLHDLLPGAALLVTGWSNSVYEAVLAGVPAITLHLLDGPAPMPFAAEGIASEARDAASAARQARALVVPGPRRAALATARAALAEHLGPLDGAAAERTAALVVRAARG